MPRLPYLKGAARTRLVTEVFTGYEHRDRIADGAFYDTENLTSEDHPLLSTRRRRGLVRTLVSPGGLLEKDALCYVDNGTLYVNELPTALTGLSSGEKQLVGMGAYVVVFPDKRYYNTEDPADFGSLEADWSLTGEVRLAPCDVDGISYTPLSGDAEPEEPANGSYWLDTSTGTLRQYSASQGTWTEVVSVYTRLSFPTQGQLPALFSRGDGVEISGLSDPALCGTKYLCAVGGASGTEDDYLVLAGLTGAAYTEQATVRVQRRVPKLDFVCECRNRLWGCFYGRDGDKTLNELYCCALGDFRNWRQYQGLSTDSWTASVGSDGPWTGAVNFLGHPVFFKSDRIHAVTVAADGGHRVEETVCRGVQRGSDKSLCVVGETLYYKSEGEVCAWQGGMPVPVSAALGDERYEQAAGGSVRSRYYLSMRASDGRWSLFVYDIARGLWMREDALQVSAFARAGDELYALEAGTGKLWALRGTRGTPEAAPEWMAETGLLYYEYPDKKYVSRYDIRLRMEQGARVKLYLEYDSSGEWLESGTVSLSGTGTATVPIRPRRCDHLRLRLCGTGAVKLFSIARNLEVGSDA